MCNDLYLQQRQRELEEIAVVSGQIKDLTEDIKNQTYQQGQTLGIFYLFR